MCSAGGVLGFLHDRVERVVGQVLGSDVGEHGACGHVTTDEIAAPDQLEDEEEQQTAVVRA